MAAIELAWETESTIEEFECTWTYDYYTVKPGDDGIQIEAGSEIGLSIRSALGLSVTVG